jgi:phage tail-like protein
MAASRVDPYASFNFIVEIDGVARAGFSECSGLGIEVEVIEYREGTDKPNTVRKLPGLIKYSAIVLKRGFTQDKSLWGWFKKVLDGNVHRANGSILLLDAAHMPALRWVFREAWPSKWEGPTLNGKSNDIAIETLEIQHEGIELME